MKLKRIISKQETINDTFCHYFKRVRTAELLV